MSAKQAARDAATIEDAAVQRVAGGRDGLAMRVIGGISEIADQPPMVAIGLATVATGIAARRPIAVRAGLRMLAAHALATGIKSAIKHRIDRTRPAEADRRGEHHVGKGTPDAPTELNSFPSGHTAGMMAVTRAAAREAEGLALPGMLVTTAIAAVQLPRGKHYLSDVIAGAAIGWIAEVATNALFDRVGPRLTDALPALGEAIPATARFLPEAAEMVPGNDDQAT